VYGKHEFITYAVALDATGAVRGIEIMDYRESYGDEVRLPRWRAQFNGRRAGQPLDINRQIQNISGATLSCVHITEGVRRILTTHATLGL
jgi:Na+-transporting NADH:ubiquinone oxidoreductase subunit NqrC